MTPFERRLRSVETAVRPPPAPAMTFVPPGVAGTDEEAAYLALERVRLGIGPTDRLLAFRWGDPT